MLEKVIKRFLCDFYQINITILDRIKAEEWWELLITTNTFHDNRPEEDSYAKCRSKLCCIEL